MSEKRPRFLHEAPDSPSREYGIYVSDIARGVTDEQLKDAFSSIGRVYDALIVKNKFTQETKGYGFVRFFNMDDVYAALDCKELPRFEDSVSHKFQTVRVTIADPKDTLYIGNIPRGWTEEDVLKILHECGGQDPRKFRFAENTKSFGFVTYRDHETAVTALKAIQRPPAGAHQTPFTAYLAPPKFSDARNAPTMKVLFVKGIGQMTSNELKELLGGQSVVEKVVIPFDSAKRIPLGHAYVHFFSAKTASEAKDKYNAYEHEEGKRLTIEWSLPKAATRKPDPAPAFPEFPPYAYPYPYPHPYPYFQEYSYPPPYYGGEFREIPYPHYPPGYHVPPTAGHSSRRSGSTSTSPAPYGPYPHDPYAYPPAFYGPTSPGKTLTHKGNRYLPYQR